MSFHYYTIKLKTSIIHNLTLDTSHIHNVTHDTSQMTHVNIDITNKWKMSSMTSPIYNLKKQLLEILMMSYVT